MKLAEITNWLEEVAPLGLSESWDNTGLLLGCKDEPVERIQTCLTLTPTSVAEAVEKKADLVIAHHPLPFKPVAKITTETIPGGMLWNLAKHGISVYAPHTAWDSAVLGINQLLADTLGLQQVDVLIPSQDPNLVGLGAGRIGTLAQKTSVRDLALQLTEKLPGCRPRAVMPNGEESVSRVAIACGSGGSLLGVAQQKECDLFLTGEATFHTCLEAEANGVNLLMVGHFASERFAMEQLASRIGAAHPSVKCWASENESDPVLNL